MRTISWVFGMVMMLAMGSAWSAGATVWRCGEDGRTYSDSPCQGGKTMTVADSRSSADEQTARNNVQRLQVLAQQMRQQRLADEQLALQRNAGPANLGPVTPEKKLSPKQGRKPVAAKRRHQLADDGTWSATARASRRTRD